VHTAPRNLKAMQLLEVNLPRRRQQMDGVLEMWRMTGFSLFLANINSSKQMTE